MNLFWWHKVVIPECSLQGSSVSDCSRSDCSLSDCSLSDCSLSDCSLSDCSDETDEEITIKKPDELTDEKEWNLEFGMTLDMLCVLLSMPQIVVERENIIIDSRYIAFRKSFSKNIVKILPWVCAFGSGSVLGLLMFRNNKS